MSGTRGVVIADNLYNSFRASLGLIRGRQPRFHLVDVTDETALGEVFSLILKLIALFTLQR